MWSRNGNAVASVAGSTMIVMRHFSSSSRKRAPDLRKINPKVPFQEAVSIAQDLYGVIKTHGPLTVSNAWNHAKEMGVNGLSSKTHMKLMLKWMRGRSMLKQICQQVGSGKKFLLTTLPKDSQHTQPSNFMELNSRGGSPKLKKQKS